MAKVVHALLYVYKQATFPIFISCNKTLQFIFQIFEWWYFKKYGTSFIEQVSLNHISPWLGGETAPVIENGVANGATANGNGNNNNNSQQSMPGNEELVTGKLTHTCMKGQTLRTEIIFYKCYKISKPLFRQNNSSFIT